MNVEITFSTNQPDQFGNQLLEENFEVTAVCVAVAKMSVVVIGQNAFFRSGLTPIAKQFGRGEEGGGNLGR
ncbi:MAG: hypothetical protein ACUVTP_12245 [Candidatus Fervidibacter sp.]|uniref:hypothetical protein n=1 Tax=Candidatus Fervidibacter sp. TaxID=3100871 RepID=UPI00404B6E4E